MSCDELTCNAEVWEHSSSGSDSPEAVQSFCSSCEQTFPEANFYRCVNCSEMVLLSQGGDVPVMLLCEHCVVIHMRKNHEVVDSKGYKPAFCQQHKNLASMFCETCQLVFCFNCIGPHCKHDYKPVSEKASDVRREIFASLNQFDQLSKPLAARRECLTRVTQRRDEVFPNSSAEKIIDELYGKCQTIISTNMDKWKTVIEQKLAKNKLQDCIEHINSNADLQITKLRSMLSMSDGVCVSEFLKSNADRKSSIEEQKSELKSAALVKCCYSLDKMLECALENVVQNLEIECIEKHLVSSFDLVLYSESGECTGLRKLKGENTGLFVNGEGLLNVEMKESGILSFSTVAFVPTLDAYSRFRTRVKVCSHKFAVSTVGAVLYCDDHVAFHDKRSNEIKIFSLSSKTLAERLPLCEESEPVCFLVGIDNLSDFIIWEEKSSCLYLYSLGDFEIPCHEKPSLVTNVGTIIAFVQLSNILTIADSMSGHRIEAIPEHHGLSAIDQVILHRDSKNSAKNAKINGLSLFNYREKKGVFCSLSVESLFWKLRVVKVRELVFPKETEESITWLTSSSGALFVSTTSKAFIESLAYNKGAPRLTLI